MTVEFGGAGRVPLWVVEGEPAQTAGVPADAQPAVVERIIDGDTLTVVTDSSGDEGRGWLPAGGGHRIRVIGIDTPETVHPDQPVECFGPEASAFAGEQLAPGSLVYLSAQEDLVDRYGRHLRDVWTGAGQLYGLTAVEQGYAEVTIYPPNDQHAGRLRAAQDAARAQPRGLWAAC